jgi:ribosomal protein L37E
VQLDARADIYALGAIAYHMLGGRPPFTGDITQLLTQKLMQAPPPLTSLRSDISAEVERAIMHALAKEAGDRPPSASEWLEEFEAAMEKQSASGEGDSRVVIMAPAGSEVYVDDERRGSVGRSGRVILTSVAPGQHVLRVARSGEADDERVIEIRPEGAEQIIQAQFKSAPSSDQLSPSQGGSLDSRTGGALNTPGVVICTSCHSRFAEGVRFCGRCGNTSFHPLAAVVETAVLPNIGASPATRGAAVTCPRCGKGYDQEVKFCGQCGIPIGTSSLDWRVPRPVEVFCKMCGTSYPAGTKFCGRCGKPIRP